MKMGGFFIVIQYGHVQTNCNLDKSVSATRNWLIKFAPVKSLLISIFEGKTYEQIEHP